MWGNGTLHESVQYIRMKFRNLYSSRVSLLVILFAVYTIGVPVVLYSCSNMLMPDNQCDMATCTSRSFWTPVSIDKGNCCYIRVVAEPNHTAYVLEKGLASLSLTLIDVLSPPYDHRASTSTDAERIEFVTIISSKKLDIPIHISSLLI